MNFEQIALSLSDKVSLKTFRKEKNHKNHQKLLIKPNIEK